MKTENYKHFAVVVLFMASLTAVNAAVLIVDNSSVSPGVYTSINAAVAAAQQGDTLYIQPTGVVYNAGSVNKPLHLIGPGHTLAWTATVAQIHSLTFAPGSNGSSLEGVRISFSVVINFGVTDITIRNNRFDNNNPCINAAGNCHNLLIEGNVFRQYAGTAGCITLDRTILNVVVRNNFFRINTSNEHSTVISNPNSSLVFDHNTVIITNQGRYCYEYTHPNMHACTGHQISNNIWIGKERDISYWAGASIFYNNQTYSDAYTYNDLPGENNLNNVLPQFENASLPFVWSVNADFNLVSSNSGYAGAAGGSQTGIHGGGFDFRMRGQPNGIPTFDQVILLNHTVPQDGNIQIRVKGQKGR